MFKIFIEHSLHTDTILIMKHTVLNKADTITAPMELNSLMGETIYNLIFTQIII